jgi:hypothetical protein
MPSFSRRGFLQFLSAASAAPFLPALPVRAAAAGAGASTSKALWAGIYAKSGSAPKFAGIARNMGLSNAAVQGVGARSVGVRLAATAMGNSASQATVRGAIPASSSSSVNVIGQVREKLDAFDQALGLEQDSTERSVDHRAETDVPCADMPDRNGASYPKKV